MPRESKKKRGGDGGTARTGGRRWAAGSEGGRRETFSSSASARRAKGEENWNGRTNLGFLVFHHDTGLPTWWYCHAHWYQCASSYQSSYFVRRKAISTGISRAPVKGLTIWVSNCLVIPLCFEITTPALFLLIASDLPGHDTCSHRRRIVRIICLIFYLTMIFNMILYIFYNKIL